MPAPLSDGTPIGLRAIGWSIPPARRTAAELAAHHGLPLDAVHRLGLVEQPVAGDGDHPSTLGAAATRHALAAAGLALADLDLLIFAGVTRDWPAPWVAAFGVLHELGATRTAGFDLNTRCAGSIDALWLARALVASGTYRTVAVCCAERFDYLLGGSRRAELPIDAAYSCGAATAIVTAGTGNDLAGFANITNPELAAHRAMGPVAGGSRQPLDPAALADRLHQWRGQLSLDAAERIARYSADADRHNYAALRAQTGFTEIDFVACSPLIPEPQLAVLEELGVPRARTLATIPYLGHIGPADLLLVLGIAIATGRSIGQRIVLSTRTPVYSNALAIRAAAAGHGIAAGGSGIDLAHWEAPRC